ncbi:carboxymethylenebutenolidase [Solitalea koreensis]|uniref:Carboxymethylenebutenolidase n=2 Tax=Solitalea koreensis TaxID=543615 RepID=A0A521ASF5_9SPHI|nr:carboxymethylenebutenolidase [Solitalea koreensis]
MTGLPFLSQAQQMSCCQTPGATASFAMLASDKQFKSSHEEPLPFHYKSVAGTDITYPTADGKTAHAFVIKSQKPTDNYVFVIHEWWGLNDYIKQESEKIYNDLGNVNVIALDLYDNQIATTREDAAKYMGAVNTERAKAIIEGAFKYVGPKAKIGTIGWCFGGGWSLQTSLLAGKQAAACVMYYGMPEKDIARLMLLNTDVLCIYGSQDQWITPKVIADFQADMKSAGKKIIVKEYNADHAFANPSNPKFDKTATEDAYKHVMEFFKSRLK